MTFAAKSQNVIVDATDPQPVYMARRLSDPYVTSTNLASSQLVAKRQADRSGSRI